MRLRNKLTRLYRKTRFFGLEKYCPLCESRLRSFMPFGIVERPQALCPVCGSLERHRFFWSYLVSQSGIPGSSGLSMLHLSPERCISERLERFKNLNYFTADMSGEAMLKMDAADIPVREKTFDVVYCCHVLEHVEDDIKALTEFKRVLRPGGRMLIQVPVQGINTREMSMTDPAEREKRFGQKDHVRLYGEDLVDRINRVGFVTKPIHVGQILAGEEMLRMGLTRDENCIYLCTKRDS